MIDFRQVASLFINNNEVEELWLNGSKVWEKTTGVAPFTIEARTSNVTIGSSRTGSPSARDLEYSVDGGNTWNTFTLGSTSVTLANAGDKMQMRGTNSTIANSWNNYWTFTFSDDVDVYGNLNSLLGGSEETLGGSFYGLFNGQTHLIDASDLVLPWTTIASVATSDVSALEAMFRNCSNLVGAPELPATTIESWCYKETFRGCSALENSMSFDHLSGALPEDALHGMFWHATNITPNLDFSNITSIGNTTFYEAFNGGSQVSGLADFSSVTSIGREGLKYTFGSCAINEIDFSSLTTINQQQAMYETFWACPIARADFSSLTTINASQAAPRLFNLNTALFSVGVNGCDFSSLETIDGEHALEEAFKGNTSLTTVEFPSLVRAGGKLADVGQTSRWTMNAMFKNCTSLESASFPSLTAFGWAANDNMFEGCTSLSSVSFPSLTTAVALWYMFDNCTSIEEVDFPELLELDDSVNTDPMKHAFYDCQSLRRVGLPKLSLITAGGNWDYAFYGCTALEEIDFSQATAVPSITWTSGNHPFTSTNNTFKIIVPDALYDTWIATSGWDDQDILPHIVNYSKTANLFCVKALQANSTVEMTTYGNAPSVSLEYSTDEGLNWSDFIVGSTTVTLTDIGDEMLLRAKTTNSTMAMNASNFNYFVFGGQVEVKGNIMSLLNKDFEQMDTIPSDYCFAWLFYLCANLYSASDMVLPATTLTPYCYFHMFHQCENLLDSPALPATTMVSHCYDQMFARCYALVNAPELPAVTLAEYCYNSMFSRCTSLVTAPYLPATTLATHCYDNMFAYDTALTSIKLEYTGNFGTSYFDGWVYQVSTSSDNIFYYDGSSTTRGKDHIPVGWTVVKHAEPVKVVAKQANSIVSMTAQGSAPSVSLEYSTDDGTTWSDFIVGTTTVTLANIDDEVWIRAGSDGNTTFAADTSNYNKFAFTGEVEVKGNLMSLIDQWGGTVLEDDYALSCLFRGNSSLVSAEYLELPTMTLTANCYRGMFMDCSNLTTPPQVLPAKVMQASCYRGMFYNCSSLWTSPYILMTTTASDCFGAMFMGCSSLAELKLTAYSGNFASGPFLQWVYGVNGYGIFYYNGSDTTTAAYACPTNFNIVSFKGLRFKATQDSTTISMSAVGNAPSVALKYSIDGYNWDDFYVGTTTVTMQNNDSVFFKADGTNTTMGDSSSDYNQFIINGSVEATGDLNSLLDEDESNFVGMSLASRDYCYYGLFKDCDVMTVAPELSSRELADHCYDELFYGCSSLSRIFLSYLGNFSTTYFNDWVYDVASLGTIDYDGDDTTVGTSALPSGWAVNHHAYLTFTARQANSTVGISKTGSPNTVYLRYSYDKVNWSTFSTANTITLSNVGDKVYVACHKGRTNAAFGKSSSAYYKFTGTGELDVSGDIRAILNFDNPTSITTYTTNHGLRNLFQNNTALIDASGLELPFTSVTGTATIARMFEGCTNLTKGPKIMMATIGTTYTFDTFFYNCSSLQEMTFTRYIGDGSGWNSWALNVASTGTIYKNGSFPTGLPSTWTQVSYPPPNS